ncbi:MAG TPA: DUF2959 family protein [Verrucomicrobiae bacterium]|nr:DUF2959 family protein [Verrucomicrobiae bacterium]
MITPNLKSPLVPLINRASVLLLAAGLAGCASPGYRKSDSAARSMQTAAAEVQAESRAIDLTLGSLKDLETEPGADLKQPYRHFSASLEHLIACARRTQNTGKAMAEKNAVYLQAWDKQLDAISFEHIRDLSQARRTEVANRMAAINQRYQQSQQVVEPLISYLLDIRRALGSDLTTGGLGSMKEIVENAGTNAAKVQSALNALTGELANSGTQMLSWALQAKE